MRAQWVRHDVVPRPRPHLVDGIQPPTGRWHRATVDRHLHPSESLPSSNHILLAKALYFARQGSNSHTCALACHKYIALDGFATRIENQQMLEQQSRIEQQMLEQQLLIRAAIAVEGGASVVEASN